MKDPLVYRALIKIMWAMWLILIPAFILIRLVGWVLKGIGYLLYDVGKDFNDLFMEQQIKLAKTIKAMESGK